MLTTVVEPRWMMLVATPWLCRCCATSCPRWPARGAWGGACEVGGAALDHAGRDAVAVQVLRHVMPAVAGAQHQGPLAAPGGAAGEAVGGHHLAAEIVPPRPRGGPR